jgi:acetyltransferase-like isoleucine patch superfamily enzyme
MRQYTIKGVVRRITRILLRFPNNWFYYLYCKYHGFPWDDTWVFHGLPILHRSNGSIIKIGKNLVLTSNPKSNSWGIIQPVIIRTSAVTAGIIIGDNVGLSGCTITARNRIEIGSDVLIGSGVVVTDNDAHPIKPENRRFSNNIKSAPVLIGDNVFIGARSLILKGVSIGDNSAIAAGSIVVKDVLPYEIVAGNPAKVIGDCRDKKYDALCDNSSKK